MKSIMTVDLEYDWESKDSKSWDTIVPKLLDFFDQNKIRATFFVVGRLIEEHEDIIRKIAEKHEIGSHSFTHANLSKLSREELEKEIKFTKSVLEDMGIKCEGFRCPFGITPKNLLGLLQENGYKYDSSMLNGYFPGRYLRFKEKPFKVSNGLVELPIPAMKYFKLAPFSLSYIRLLYPLSLRMIPEKPLVFNLHPHEFLNEKPGKEISLFVRHFGSRYQGDKAWKILEKVVDKFEWISCKDYLDSKSLS